MEIPELSTRSLIALITLVEQGHFGAAASRLWVSPPALSQQIRRLENHVGARLVDRATHPITLTPAGEAFLPHARQVVQSVSDGLAAIERLERDIPPILRIGFINGGVGSIWSSIVAQLNGAVNFTLLEWPDQISAVVRGDVDASLVRSPLTPVAGTHLQPLAVEKRFAVVHRDHPLAGNRRISISELDGETYVGPPAGMDETWIRWWAIDPRPSGARVNFGTPVHSIDELLQVVSTGAAVAITAETIRHTYAGADVEFVEVHDVEPSRTELCTRAEDDNPRVVELREVVARHWAASRRSETADAGIRR
ncbi:LysR family transcriptional regulator [Microbacterium koreense]|uniref:LysR family transcriptional regulator n=1 Tax=Microbacterium koreense TaxID=323761 RepID=A0ABW2ZR66_9MICO